jgi:hypothetical protein
MEVTLNIGWLLNALLLNNYPQGEDAAEVIGDSRVAYVGRNSGLAVFLGAARWHDAAYGKGASIQSAWSRWQVDAHFLKMMLDIAKGDVDLERDALMLYLLVRKYAAPYWEGVADES